jgi:Leucine-rich repeat (LRR) protein
LDVSGCSALKELECSYNALTSLDVSGCTALEVLSCYNNALTDLDASECMALRALRCHNNQLSSLDISKNMVLACENNQLLLSELYDLSIKIVHPANRGLGTQFLPIRQIVLGDTIDFSTQASFGSPAIATVFNIEKDSLPAIIDVDYTINNGIIMFKKEGNYTITMTNEAIVSNYSVSPKVIASINVKQTDIAENTLLEMTVSPNPTKQKLTIDAKQVLIEQIILYDEQGRTLYIINNINDNIYTLDLQDLVFGVYLIEIKTEKGISIKKIIRE